MKLYHSDEVARRRALFQKLARGRIGEVVNPDGSGKIPQFNPPWREVFWIAPALYCGGEADIALANRMIGRYFSAPRLSDYLRITIGTPEQMQRFFEELDLILG